MSESAPELPAPTPAQQPGFFSRAAERVLPHLEHAGAEAAAITQDVASALEDHAGTVLDITGEALALLRLADPADAALFSAIAALVPRVLDVAVRARTIAGAARGAAPAAVRSPQAIGGNP